MTTESIQHILDTFTPITLDEMDAVKLMNRSDTKFTFHVDKLPMLLNAIKPYYSVLKVNEFRIGRYNTIYYDTDDNSMFTDHQNGLGDRYKIRRRDYLNDHISFLEIKHKTNKGKTQKKRIVINDTDDLANENICKFIEKRTEYKPTTLGESIHNAFSRITLVNKNFPERATLDFNLSFATKDKQLDLPFLAIAEIKQEKQNALSDIKNYLLYQERLKPQSMSKYCLGALLLKDDIKYNTFKEKLYQLQKLSNDGNFASHIIKH